MVNSCDTPRYTPPPPPEPPPISRAKHVGGGWQTSPFWCEGVRAPDHPEDCGGFCWIGTFGWSWSWRRGKALAPCVPKQRRGDCGGWNASAQLVFAIELASKLDLRDGVGGVRIGYEAKGIRVQPKEATRASVAPRRRRACHGGRGQDGAFFSPTRDGALEHAREMSGVRVLQS